MSCPSVNNKIQLSQYLLSLEVLCVPYQSHELVKQASSKPR